MTNIAAQTGLTATLEKRKIRVLVVKSSPVCDRRAVVGVASLYMPPEARFRKILRVPKAARRSLH